jgi:hypothetical protein
MHSNMEVGGGKVSKLLCNKESFISIARIRKLW